MMMLIRTYFILFLFMSYNALNAQDYISTDSLKKHFYLFQDTSSTCTTTQNAIPCNWFKLRNTALGLVVYDIDNNPFNFKFINSDTFFQDDYFEVYHFIVDSTKKNKEQYSIYCHDTVAWGDVKIQFQFSLVHEKMDIYSLSTIMYRVGKKDTQFMVDTTISPYLYMPFRKSKRYYVLAEPNRTSIDSRVQFIREIDYNRIVLYRKENDKN